jgi:hypothetical protein
MNKGKGIGAGPIVAVAFVSAMITIILDYFGVTTWVQAKLPF